MSNNMRVIGAAGARTVDHDEIREWVEARGGRPVIMYDSWLGGAGICRIDFGEEGAYDLGLDPAAQEMSWEEFFDVFEGRNLAFLYQEEAPDGRQSRYFKFIARDGEEDDKKKGGGKPQVFSLDDEDERKKGGGRPQVYSLDGEDERKGGRPPQPSP